MMKLSVLTFAGIALLMMAVGLPASSQEAVFTNNSDLVFRGSDFNDGSRQKVRVEDNELSLAPQADSGQYISPILNAPISFNALVPQWIADVPDSAGLTLQLRTGRGDGSWSEWYTVHENHDWTLPDDPDVVGEMVTVPAGDVTHQKIQFALTFDRSPEGLAAVLDELRITFIDTSQGPTAEALVANLEAEGVYGPEAANGGYPKPPVISRSSWCTHPDCNYSDGLKYESVTHLVLHHTVSGSSDNDWAALVRAIWNFHTYTRGWGDIGYNYLVDPNGIIYEGHLGGDDVAGTHAAGANEGSMGVAMMGDFRTSTPPPAMRESVAKLFSWKADQKNIDVYDSSTLPEMDWGLPHLMGHRDVYGTTECPGDQGHSVLPWLRDEVAKRINLKSPYIYFDELSSIFTRSSSSSWYSSGDLAIPGCGFDGHTYYTWSTTNSSSSSTWGEWRLPIGEKGQYEIQALTPFCKTGTSETEGARYKVTHANGTKEVVISQQGGLGNWSSLGKFTLNAGNSTVVRLTDLVTTDNGAGVWFDALRIRPVEPCPKPLITNQAPIHDSWVTQRVVTFKWSISGAFCVANTTLEIATDHLFKEPLLSVALDGAATSHQVTFTQDYPHLYWRVKATTTDNQVNHSPVSHFGIDTEKPSSQVFGIYKLFDGSYYLTLSGEDSGSGVVSYNVDYRFDGESKWKRWLTSTSSLTNTIPWKVEEPIWFRSQATDALGNVEPLHTGDGDMNTDQVIQLHRVIMFPHMRSD